MNLNSLVVRCITARSQLYNYQTVRFIRPRKPFWLGMAKSKMFVIREPPKIPEEERDEINKIKSIYNTQLTALMNFITVEDPKLKSALEDSGKDSQVDQDLEKKISDSYEINNVWNAESDRRREIRLKESMERTAETICSKISVIDGIKMREMELIENAVRKEKELSKSYITPENLDEEVEKCLNKVDCFDFAIDLEGNRYPGREPVAQ